MKTVRHDALLLRVRPPKAQLPNTWLPLCLGVLIAVVNCTIASAQDPQPQEIRLDGPFRLPTPPYAVDSSVPTYANPYGNPYANQSAPVQQQQQTAPVPAQPVNGPVFAPYMPVPYQTSPYQTPLYQTGPYTDPNQAAPYQPYQLAPFQAAPPPAYAAPQFNAPQNGPAPYQLPTPPADYQQPSQQPYQQPQVPTYQPPTAQQLPPAPPVSPSPAAAPAEVKPPVEVVPTPPPAEKSTAPLLVEESGWGSWAPKVLDPWEGSVELGMNGTDGNSQTFNIRFGVTAKHKTETFVQSVQLTSIQKSANGNTTANTALLDGRLEWPMPNSRLNYFIHGLAEYDEFKAFDARLSGDTGFGYEFIQNDMTTLVGRSGIAFSNEIGGPDTTVHPELLFGGEFKHKFNPTHSISMKVDYYPDVTEFGDFRLNSQASWELALSQAWGMSLKFSIIDRYDSTPQGAKPNDLDYSTLLLWQF
ncbi:YdiY family protein [Anatilimnocola sp. NA78]|uniref:DUF481 domain-containing protein n=1 Tax=Anatilimnocola sp. NA78 TaxID=3415683 RepID=UPI003CE4C055